jgi:hypothetical protein
LAVRERSGEIAKPLHGKSRDWPANHRLEYRDARPSTYSAQLAEWNAARSQDAPPNEGVGINFQSVGRSEKDLIANCGEHCPPEDRYHSGWALTGEETKQHDDAEGDTKPVHEQHDRPIERWLVPIHGWTLKNPEIIGCIDADYRTFFCIPPLCRQLCRQSGR